MFFFVVVHIQSRNFEERKEGEHTRFKNRETTKTKTKMMIEIVKHLDHNDDDDENNNGIISCVYTFESFRHLQIDNNDFGSFIYEIIK